LWTIGRQSTPDVDLRPLVVMARYDGHADWYHDQFEGYASAPGSSGLLLREVLGDAVGRWLDLACGTGLHFEALQAAGRAVVGIDLSADQLRVASVQSVPVVRGDATALPFAAGTFDGVSATYLHTDVDDVAPVFTEVARVLRPGGRFVYVGTHPCFVGHFVERRGDGRRVLHDGYFDAGWRDSSPFFGPGLRRRVGARHATLSELVNKLLATGLRLHEVLEPHNDEAVPMILALVADRSSGERRAATIGNPKERARPEESSGD
jgi:SAM-dependent methyltransferase